MKKKYVAPKSELFALQLNENIPASGGDEITGSMTIRFTQAAARCRSLYSGVEGATNVFGDEDNVWVHYAYISGQMANSAYLEALRSCIS